MPSGVAPSHRFASEATAEFSRIFCGKKIGIVPPCRLARSMISKPLAQTMASLAYRTEGRYCQS